MKKFLTSSTLSALFRWLLGSIFIYAGVFKIADPWSFSDAIYNYRILPDFLIDIFALWIPWLEILSGLALIIGKWIKGGTFILLMLIIVFIIALGAALFRGIDISCGCFGLDESRKIIDWSTIAKDFGLLLMCLQVLFFDQSKYALIKIRKEKSVRP
ncbi:MAG: DoxX family membrane protein [Desulfobacterales bacterium]|nr:DoxX family membrane protein [Desulfobacterales bacterium]